MSTKSNHVIFWNGIDINRASVHDPIQEGVIFNGYVSRKKSKLTGNFRLSLYSQNLEKMILTCEKSVHKFIISLNSFNMEKLSSSFVGYYKMFDPRFIGVSWHPQIDYSHREMIRIIPFTPDLSSFEVIIPNLGNTIIVQDDQTNNFNYGNTGMILFGKLTTEQKEGEDRLELIVKNDNQDIINIKQIHEDEYSVQFTHPLSVFQMFCFCVWIMKKNNPTK